MGQLGRLRRVASAGLMLLPAFLAVACGGTKTSIGTVVPRHRGPAGVINWWAGYGADWPDSLDPAVGTNTAAINAESLVDANLVKLSYPSLKIVGQLASRWRVSDQGRTYTFSIRRKARFSNGDDVTAQDVVWSLTRALMPATKSSLATVYLNHIRGAGEVASGKAKTVEGLRALSSKTLRIELDRPVAYFLQALSSTTADVLDEKVMQGKPAGTFLTNTCSGNVGAGPFEFQCRNKTSTKSSFHPAGQPPYMDFAPNPYYFGRKPRVKIHVPLFSSADAVFKAYRAGDLDGAVVPSDRVDAARIQPGFVSAPQLETDFITPNAQTPPFDNAHCRLAVAYAIDRETITRKVLRGTEGPLYDMVPPGLLGYFGKEPDVPAYDPARAKRELAQCPGGLKHLTITVQNASPDTVREYESIRDDIRRIGGDVSLKLLNFNAWLNVVTQNMNATKAQEQMTENLWIDTYPDPQDWCTNLMHSGAAYNIGGFKSATYDRLVDSADVNRHGQMRAKLYKRAQKIALAGGYWISVGYLYGSYIINPRIHGLIATNGGTWPVDNDWSKVSISG